MTCFDETALRRLRKGKKLSAEALAVKAKISVRTIRELERGAQEPKAATLGRLAQALGVPTDAFFIDRRRSA